MFRKFIVAGMLAIALAMGIAMPLAAQSKTIKWTSSNKNLTHTKERTLVGMEYSNTEIHINKIKFGEPLGGPPNVVEILEDGPGGKAGTKTTLNKIAKGNSYVIKLTNNHSLEIAGSYTESGLTGDVFYLVRGPAEIFLNTKPMAWNYPDYATLGFSANYRTWVFFDRDLFSETIARQFVDKYVIPWVGYNEITNMYNDIKKKFPDNTAKCPENIGCLCKGDIAEHIVYSLGIKDSLISGAIGALPFAASLPAEAYNEAKKTKNAAVMIALVGYHYKRFPNLGLFQSRFRDDAIILFSEANIPSAIDTMAGSAVQELVMNSSSWFIKQVAPKFAATSIPGIGNVIGFAISGITKAIEVRRIGDRAKKYYKSSKK